MTDPLRHFQHIWSLDFEFHQPPGERPTPICMVAHEWRSGRRIRLWLDDRTEQLPFDVGPESLFIAYYASAELGCFLALDWPMPKRILDLYVEFRLRTNGLSTPCGNSLLGALAYLGLGAIDAAEKDDMRELAIRGGPYTRAEQHALVEYCETDVVSLRRLFDAMLPEFDWPRALLRGRFMASAAHIERNGTPIDVETLQRIKANWEDIKAQLIREIDREFGVYSPTVEVNPDSKLGEAILASAAEYGIDPSALAVMLDFVWRRERDIRKEFDLALVAARKATGLTARRIEAWENAGRDYSTWPSLDTRARSLAAELPALNIGTGYVHEESFDDTDYAERIWELLREPPRKPVKKIDLVATAADECLQSNAADWTGSYSFSAQRFGGWLADQGIPWPRLESGKLALDDSTFRRMAKSHPAVAPIRELRHTLGELRLFDLAVGRDGRNRCLLSAFRSLTGRNQPSNAKFIFGPSCWVRSLIQPQPGRALAYVDWSQQEFGIAAALSGDAAMMEAYRSGDPYLTFAKQAGAVPSDATKQSHAAEREQFKVCALAVQYGMGSQSLAESLGQPESYARELLRLHRETYATFWAWSESAVNCAMLRGRLWTVFGWEVRVGARANPRSLANFPMQANGAEMLRLAACLAVESGVSVCALIHDAMLVEASEHQIEATVGTTQDAMQEASEIVLSGFPLRSDATVIKYPDRYTDPRGQRLWNTIQDLCPQEEHAPF